MTLTNPLDEPEVAPVWDWDEEWEPVHDEDWYDMNGPCDAYRPLNDLPGGWEPALTETVPASPDYDPGDPFAEE